jgi:capsular exopolysaccharide synthesis family protein
MVRTKIMHHPDHPRAIVISSASPGDGKTVTAVNLAIVLALKKDSKVILIDGDLRRSGVSKCLEIPPTPGLEEVLSGQCTLDDALVQAQQLPNLWILPGKMRKHNPAELLESAALRQLIADCKQRFSYLIIDTTPIDAVTDYELVQVVCEGLILVVRPDHTDKTLFLKALSTIPKQKLIGTIMNCVDDWFLWKQYGYGYGYPYTPPTD